MKKCYLPLIIIVFNSLNLFSQDLISGGTNSWLFHTPDDGRTSLHIAPLTNGTWDWSKQTIFFNDGSIGFNGNVGIGTIDPNYRLEVKGGDSKFDPDYKVFIPSVGTSYFWKGTQDGVDNVKLSVWYKIGIYNPTTGGINTNNSDWNIRFCARYGIVESKGSAYFALTSGNVGIGTSETGTHKLAVDGTIGAREIVVETGSWSDFVFKKDYELKDLKEVESFIEENNHLPDIPSENEVLENGIPVGEMNAKLLQKIEELTLYMIEQNKKTEILSEKVEILASENELLKGKIIKLEAAE